jgi:xanthine dehydrogenase accessory factor
MKQLKTWQLIDSSLQQNLPVMLLYVLESTGSSPGRQGFFMAVNANGEIEGSIGGGIMEHKFVETAKGELGVGSLASLRAKRSKLGVIASRAKQVGNIRKQIHDKSSAKNQSGMICSGEQTILLYPVQQKDGVVIRQIIASLEKNKNGTLILSPGMIEFSDSMPEKDFEYHVESEEQWIYKEKTGYKKQLFIIGGGHCALALSRLMWQMDFYIRLYEDRSELHTLSQNEFVHEKIMVDDYSQLAKLVPAGDNHYVVIMTVGYRTDDIAIRALRDKTFAYIGLLGSRSKTQKMLDEYRQEGINPEWLQQIHAPVGLAINSQTPEEIAVSIAGALILVANARE